MTFKNVIVQFFLILMVPGCLLVTCDVSVSFSDQNTYCVTRSEKDTNTTCHTLKYYIQNSARFFLDNKTFVFLPGIHYTDPNASLIVQNVSRLTLRGENAAIHCQNRSNYFHFDLVHSLLIQDISFIACGAPMTYESVGNATLLVTNGTDLTLTSVLISYSDYQGLYIDNNLGNVTIVNVTIEDCHTNQFERPSNKPRTANIIYFSRCPQESSLVIRNTVFQNNSNFGFNNFPLDVPIDRYPFAAGFTMVIKCDNVNVLMDNITADRNHGGDGGNLAIVFHTHALSHAPPVVINNSRITNGRAIEGGGLFVSLVQPMPDRSKNKTIPFKKHTILDINNTVFENNSAIFLGGAIGIRQKESASFMYVGDIEIHNCTFFGNSLKLGGHGATAINSINFIVTEPAPHITPQFRTFVTDCKFHCNFVKKNLRKSSGSSVVFVKENPYFYLGNVVIDSNNSTAILGLASNLIFSGNVTLSNNNAQSGGGLLLCQNAVMFLDVGVNLIIENNHAVHTGGGIAVEAICLVSKPICFFQLVDPSPQNYEKVNIYINNNTAGHAGANLYGGSVEYCYMIENSAHNSSANHSLPVFKKIFHIEQEGAGLPYVTSPPDHVCRCFNNVPSCNNSSYEIEGSVYPGQPFTVELLLAGQLDGAVPGIVETHIHDTQYSTLGGKFQKTDNVTCKNFTYTIFSNESKVTMDIGAAQQGDTSVTEYLKQYRQLQLNMTISECPQGFSLSETHPFTCVCKRFFEHNIEDLHCNISNHKIEVPQSVWIGYFNESNSFITNKSYVRAAYCPEEYCMIKKSYINVSLDTFDQNVQCQNSRSGIMCGGCIETYSVQLGGPYCGVCSNKTLSLLVVFAFAGLFLVFTLTILNITVTDGTINGLIFYAHIVQAHSTLLFVKETHFSRFLRIFIAWLNLEFGIRSCFFNGMTEYDKAWLQFAFPFYIWIILGIIVLLSRRFSIITRLVGRNAVKIFATLILLSYPTLFRALISTMDATSVYTSHEEHFHVWTKDGSVRYLHGKHLGLFIFSACVAVVCFPFTLSLLFVQVLERYSHYRILCLVRKLKPLWDAYTGPYTYPARFWTGFLLLVRIIIFVATLVNGRTYTDLSIMVTVVLILLIFVIASVIRAGIYEKSCWQVLEFISILNLGLLLVATMYIRHRKNHIHYQTTCTNVSASVAFAFFFGVFVYHILRRIYSLPRAKNWVQKIHSKFQKKYARNRADFDSTGINSVSRARTMPPFVRFDEEREPLLGDDED